MRVFVALMLLGVAAAQAPTPSTCVIPWPDHGRWTDCQPELTKGQTETCNFEHEFGYKCTYPDGPISCNEAGKFEMDFRGPNKCSVIPSPPMGGCAKYDLDANTCKTVEGCRWDAHYSWCSVVCRHTGCGEELHKRNPQCAFSCPLKNATACIPWQAGCNCVQDTSLKACTSWCQDTNIEPFAWLPKITTPSFPLVAANDNKTAVSMPVSSALAFQNDAGYDPMQLCIDGCFQRGVCISPPVGTTA